MPSDIHESGEDYLEAILVLKNKYGFARSVDVAKHLGVSKPSVSRAMSVLEETGYIDANKLGSIRLTEKGESLAAEIYGRHVLLTKFLMKITNVSEEQASRNACKIEHDIDIDIKKGIERWMNEHAND